MKKVLLTLLAIVVIVGLLGAAGFAGYRFGYMRGAQTTVKAATPNRNPNPQLRPFDRRGMPMRNFGDDFGRGFHHGFRFGIFPMMGMGFGLFGLFGFLIRIAIFGLVIWFIYWLVTRSSWRLTRTVPATPPSPQPPASTETEVKEE